MTVLSLTIKSMLSRKMSVVLLMISIALSTMLFIGVQKIKISAKKSFSNSISGTDVIVGARSGDVQLLMYTVFRQGRPVANMSWDSVMRIQSHPQVAWLVPLSLGDSHRGYPVLGTNRDYFEQYKYGNKQSLRVSAGRIFEDSFDVVIGSAVANALNYHLGQALFLTHGTAVGAGAIHTRYPFQVVGILAPTGTPVDNTIHVPLAGITAIHSPHAQDNATVTTGDGMPQSVTGCLIGLTSRFSIFSFQQTITNWPHEPLMAIIPGLTLSTLWHSIRTIDDALLIITVVVAFIACIGLLLGLFLALQQRTHELAILRMMGAHPWQLSVMLIMESMMITTVGVVLGGGLMVGVGYAIKPILEARMGLILSFSTITASEWMFAGVILMVGLLTSLIPAMLVYQKGKHKGCISI